MYRYGDFNDDYTELQILYNELYEESTIAEDLESELRKKLKIANRKIFLMTIAIATLDGILIWEIISNW